MTSGPFEGMWIGHDTDTTWGGVSYYLAGTYEDELNRTIEAEIARRPPVVIDIGCAEGYYAVGLARRLPESTVIASDVLPAARQQCRALAARNQVEVTVVGECTAQSLNGMVVPGALVICDCEGAELELLDPVTAPGLASACLIVELHDFVNPTISTVIAERFNSTHVVEFVAAQPKTARQYPHLSHLSPTEVWRAVDEHRPGVMEWAVMRPRGQKDVDGR